MKDLLRKLLFPAVITLVSFAPMAHAKSSAIVLGPPKLVIQMPEPSSATILAADLMCVGALIFALRRRMSRTNR
jgi:hypothetical protein